MSPEEFEKYIASLFDSQGYHTELTSKSYDYGVDIIATKENERIAIQVKMYDSRPVNYKDVMYLYAGKDYYDCDRGIVITTGYCENLAVKVAIKLGIEIQERFLITKLITPTKSDKLNSINNDFDHVWQTFIKPLKGQKIFTATGMENLIVEVNNDFLERKSSTGKVSKIDKQIFKTIFYRLKEKKSVTRDEVNTEYPGRGSAIIVAVLGRVPFIRLIEKPKATITFIN